MTTLCRVGFSTALALCSIQLAWSQPDPSELFPVQAEVYVESDALSRLELTSEVLTQVQADLSDVRLFDAQGREVPYLIDRGQPQPERMGAQRDYRPAVQSVDRMIEEAGEREPSEFREHYILTLPEDVSLEGHWRLIVGTSIGEFVRRLDVKIDEAGGERVFLIEGESLFRLRNGGIQRLGFDLPRMPRHSLYVEIEGDGAGFLSPQFLLRQSHSFGERLASEVELEIVDRSESGGLTLLDVERPRGLGLTALRIGTSSRTFVRDVSVFDGGTGRPDRAIGQGQTIYRVPTAIRVENLEIAVSQTRGDRLRISIANGDSPPLQDLSVTALTTSPALLFSLAAGETAMLRFGGGRTARPRYDLAALGMVLSAEGVSSEMVFRDPVSARLGPVVDNPSYSAGPLLSFASRPGAVVNDQLYSHVRYVDVAPSPEGLSRLEISVQDAAQAHADFADLRLVDENTEQWAYLLQPNARREWLSLTVATEQDEETSSSIYDLALPASPAAVDRLRLEFDDEFFDRPYTLLIISDGTEREIAHGRLTRSAAQREQSPVEIEWSTARGDVLRLEVFNGNDAPLGTPNVEGRFPLPDLYTVAPAGAYRLLVGYPDDEAPVYELERAASTVLAARGALATLGEFVENPRFSSSSRLWTGAGSQRALFWVALLLAVGVLGRMTLKTVSSDT